MSRSHDARPDSTPRDARILVVQPNRNYLGVLARRLVEAGFRVTTADCASAAIAELHRLPVDLVLAELRMAPTSGVELARMIRDEVIWRDLPVMLITGKSEPTGAVRAYEAGADDVILKPFHFEVLFARIDRRIARVRSIKALREDNTTLDARIVKRAIEIGELRDQLMAERAKALR
jgi:DNA-binding response OmpR family regulator